MTQLSNSFFRVVTPKSYVYKPGTMLTSVMMSGGIAWLILVAPSAVGLSDRIFEWGIGLLVILIAFLSAFRLLMFQRFLVVGDDHLEIPSGFLKISPKRIAYENIQRCWEMNLVGRPVLCIATDKSKVEVVSWMLSDLGCYFEIREHLVQRLMSLRKQQTESVCGQLYSSTERV